MNFFQRLSIGTKLWCSVGFIVLAMSAVIVSTAGRSAQVTAESEAVLNVMSAKVELATRWAGLVETNVTRVQAQIISGHPEIDALYRDLIPATVQSITAVQNKLEAKPLSPAERALMDRIAQERRVVLDALAAVRELKSGGDVEGARRAVDERFNPSIPPYIASLNEFAQMQGTLLLQSQQVFAERRQANVRMATLWVVLLIVGIIVGAFFLIRSIRQPLNEAVSFAQAIATGNLTVQLTSRRQDEFGTMILALNDMRSKLVHVVTDVRKGTDNISVAAHEIASGNHDLSARTEQTASNLEETAASMEEISGTIRQSADAARTANQLATTAGLSAEHGGKVVGEVIRTMEEINQASRKINDIIGVIDGIAFQTNILALNAAVEAARAGEQGRGFAVVAGEVRTLAQRSAQAAREIKTLIGNSVDRVTVGSEQVNQAGVTMREIVDNVTRVRDIISEIAASASEQADGVTQVNAAVTHLDQMTQQNAALVEQSAAAATSMSEQAAQLAEVVKVFRLDASDTAPSGMRDLKRPSAAPVRPVATRSAIAVKPKKAATPAPKPATATQPKALTVHKSSPAAKPGDEWDTF
jgi:methyl-accepting chemotaxis protein